MQEKIQNISPIKHRILSFAQTLGISKREFYITIGVSRGTLESKTGITEDVVAKFIARYPQVNIEWLLTGKGEMLKANCTSQQNSALQVPIDKRKYTEKTNDNQDFDPQNIQTRPRIPLDAAAGSLSVAISSVAEHECERLPLIPTLPNYDFTIIARGDSMEPAIESGDELACRLIKESAFIQWGHTHVLDTAQGIIVKRIFENKGNIQCRSNNENYPDFFVSKDEIYHIGLVVGLLRHF